jgi:DNA-binding cell septation regulator SpoVG
MGKATLAEAQPSQQPEKIVLKGDSSMVDISEVRIIPIRPKDFGLVGFASLVINKAIYLGSIAIMAAPDGVYYLVYPQRKSGKSQFSMFHPVDKRVASAIEKAVLEKYESIMLPNEEWSYRQVTGL